MKTRIENVKKTEQKENFEIINRVLAVTDKGGTIEQIFNDLKKVFAPIVFWEVGLSGSHIWVKNSSNERLILITEF